MLDTEVTPEWKANVTIHIQPQTATRVQGAIATIQDLAGILSTLVSQESADLPKSRTCQEVLLEDDIPEKAVEPLLKIQMQGFSHLVSILRLRLHPRRGPFKSLHLLQLLLSLLKPSRLVVPHPQLHLHLSLHNWALSPRLCLHRLRCLLYTSPSPRDED